MRHFWWWDNFSYETFLVMRLFCYETFFMRHFLLWDTFGKDETILVMRLFFGNFGKDHTIFIRMGQLWLGWDIFGKNKLKIPNGATLFLEGLTSTKSPGLERSKRATPSHWRIESTSSKYRRDSSFSVSLLAIHVRNAPKSVLNWIAPKSLKSQK